MTPGAAGRVILTAVRVSLVLNRLSMGKVNAAVRAAYERLRRGRAIGFAPAAQRTACEPQRRQAEQRPE